MRIHIGFEFKAIKIAINNGGIMKNVFTLTVLIFTFGLSGAYALDSEHPCKADREKFCSQIEPGDGRVVKCLKEHKDELSPSCKAFKESKKESREQAREACKEDVKKLCDSVEKGEGRKVKCLIEKQSQASSACQQAIANIKGHHASKEKSSSK